jgi:hypothetical protein
VYLAAKTRPKEKDYSHSNSLGAPIAEGAKLRTDRALQQCGRAIRSAMWMLSLTRHHFQNNASALKISASKINSEKKAKQKTKYLVK